MCAKDAPFRTGKDLNGKTIGLQALRDNGQLGPMAWIEQTGGDPNSIKWVELPVAEAAAAIAPQFMQNSWFTTAEWLKKNPVAASRFVSAIFETTRWANRNHKASAAIFEEHSEVAPEIIETMNRSVFAERFDSTLFQPVIDAAAKYKMIDHAFPATEIMATPARM